MSAYRATFGDLLEPGFREIFDDTYQEKPQVFPQVFKVNSSTKQDEKDSAISGFGMMNLTDEGGQIDYEDVVQGYDNRYTHLKYTKGFKISEELYEDDQYNVMKKKPQALARSARRTAEYLAATTINSAFTSTATGGDGYPICSTTHPRADGGTAQSNANASGITLTETNLETARVAFRGQLDEKGMRIQAVPDRLIVPINLEKQAHVIVDANLRSNTADNDPNFYKGMFKIVTWEYLTSTTAWFLQDSTLSEIMWFWRVKPEFKQDVAFDTGMARFKTRMRCSNGWSNWRGFWGSKGDGAAYAG